MEESARVMTTGFAVSLVFGPLGVLLGAAHFEGLRWNAGLYLAPGRHTRALGLHALRTAVTAGTLFAIGRLGPIDLLAAFAGLWVGRQAVIARSWRVQ